MATSNSTRKVRVGVTIITRDSGALTLEVPASATDDQITEWLQSTDWFSEHLGEFSDSRWYHGDFEFDFDHVSAADADDTPDAVLDAVLIEAEEGLEDGTIDTGTILVGVGGLGVSAADPDDTPDAVLTDTEERSEDVWQELGRVTIDTGMLLLADPIHAGVDVGNLDKTNHMQVSIRGGDYSAVLVHTGMGDGRYVVSGRYRDCPFGRRLAEIRVQFLGESGEYLGSDEE
jgi:hypothetical protein